MENPLSKFLENRKKNIHQNKYQDRSYCYFQFVSQFGCPYINNLYRSNNIHSTFIKSYKNCIRKSKALRIKAYTQQNRILNIPNQSKQSKQNEQNIYQQNLPTKFILTSKKIKPRYTTKIGNNKTNKEKQQNLKITNRKQDESQKQNEKIHHESHKSIQFEDDYLKSKLKDDIRNRVDRKMRKIKSRESVHKNNMEKTLYRSCKNSRISTPNYMVS